MADRTTIFLLCTILLVVAALLVFAMRYFTSFKTAQARVAAEGSYRSIAERAVHAQEQGSAALAEVRREMADLNERIGRIEKMLKDVG